MNAFWSAVLEQLNDGHPTYIAMVANHSRHSPGTRGAKLAVTKNTVLGTIGGGVMEHTIINEARARLGEGDFFLHEILAHRESGTAKRSGLFCSGEQSMVYAVATPGTRSHDVVKAIVRAREDDAPGFFSISGSGWETDKETWDRNSAPIGFLDGTYRELLLNPFRVAIVGGGHCGRALSQVLNGLGYHVCNIDNREDEALFQSNVWANRRIVADYASAADHVSHSELTHFIVMTADFPSDVAALQSIGEKRFPFVGVMGSAAKIARIRAQIDPKLSDVLRAPIGLKMSSDTPEEIAISIAAQILQERESLFPWTAPTTSL